MNRWYLAFVLCLALLAPTARAQIVVDDPAQAGDGAILDFAARTAGTAVSARLTSQGKECLLMTVQITVCGTCNLVPTVQGWDNTESAYFVWYAPTALVATGTTRYLVCPNGGGTGITSASVSKMPPYWRVSSVLTGTATYVVGGVLY